MTSLKEPEPAKDEVKAAASSQKGNASLNSHQEFISLIKCCNQ